MENYSNIAIKNAVNEISAYINSAYIALKDAKDVANFLIQHKIVQHIKNAMKEIDLADNEVNKLLRKYK